MKLLVTLAALLLTTIQAQASDDWEIKLKVSPTSGTTPLTVSVQTTVEETPTSSGCGTLSTGTVCSAGLVWMDRNLGASQIATSSTDSAAYGDLYQWGRGADGHEKRDSATTSTTSSSDNPGHRNFILPDSSQSDWRVPQNDNLWQGVSGTNNPCPARFRLPTDTELRTEYGSWSSNDSDGAFGSPLKLVAAGFRWGGLQEARLIK